MEFEHIFKIVIGSLLGLGIAGYSNMTKDVVKNSVEIKQTKEMLMKMDKKVDDIHWHFIRSKK
tara:strand:+ start:2542 stop:2730 length:189 start_codon:yes stop_codon:yes gene_type:complete